MKEKGTILYIGGFDFPDKNAAALRVLSNSKIFSEIGFNVVFIGVDKAENSNNDILKTHKKIFNYDYYTIPYPKSIINWTRYLTIIHAVVKICNLYKDTKAIIAYNYPALALWRLKQYSNKMKLAIIGDCTEWYSVKGEKLLFKIIKGLDSFFRMRIIHKKLDGLIVISTFLQNYYNKNNVIKLPPLIDSQDFKWNNSNKTVMDNKIKLIYFGNPGKYKDNIYLMIETLYKLKQFDNFILTIIGVSKNQYITKYSNHKNILNTLGERVKFLGFITHIEALNHLKNSDFSLIFRDASRLNRAGFPTKLVESISCGIPVITTKIGDAEEFIVDGKHGYFIDLNDMEMVENKFIDIFKSDKSKIDNMKEHCKESNLFDYRRSIKIMDEFINEIIL